MPVNCRHEVRSIDASADNTMTGFKSAENILLNRTTPVAGVSFKSGKIESEPLLLTRRNSLKSGKESVLASRCSDEVGSGNARSTKIGEVANETLGKSEVHNVASRTT